MSGRRNLRSRPNSESTGLGQCQLCCEQDSNEALITCNLCANQFHPVKCLLLSEDTLQRVLDKVNQWSCNKCKSCEICRKKKYLRNRNQGGISDKTLILCKGCDKGFHRSCIKKALSSSSGGDENFYCRLCQKEKRVHENLNGQCTDEDEEEEEEEEEKHSDDEDDEVDVEGEESFEQDSECDENELIGNDEDEDNNELSEDLNEEPEYHRIKGKTRNNHHYDSDSNDANIEELNRKSNRKAKTSNEKLLSFPGKKTGKGKQKDEIFADDHKLSLDQEDTDQPRRITRSRTAKSERPICLLNTSTDTLLSDIDCSTSSKKRKLSGKCSSLFPIKEEDSQSRLAPEDSDEESRDRRYTACCVPGCDSKGHLSGKFDTHLTMSTCPLFHNLTPEECVQRYEARTKRRGITSSKQIDSQSRQTLRSVNTKWTQSDKIHQLVEQRRKEASALLVSSNNSDSNQSDEIVQHSYNLAGKLLTGTGREPNLKHLTPIFDYEMFREAQSRAAELLQEQFPSETAGKQRQTGIKHIQMGKYEIETWYTSPYPEEYHCLPKLYICEFCLKYFNSPLILGRHLRKCSWHCPPGDEIYRKGSISIFEVDGERNKFYCQNLCLLAKLFLDHKTLYYDVEPFRFYILTESDSEGFHIIGYFSKEKMSFLNYNVSCILTFPPYQKKGYGRLLIDFSYLLTRVEGKVGSPEKPLSDLGLISYRSYWKTVILEYLCKYQGSEISIKDLSQETGINAYDIVSTLQALGMLKYWKGKHLVLTRKDILDDYRSKMKKKRGTLTIIDESCLHWKPLAGSNSHSQHPPTNQQQQQQQNHVQTHSSIK